MTHDIQTKINSLLEYIKDSTINRYNHHPDQKAKEAELSWGASHFWANIIYKSERVQNESSVEKFYDFKKSYEDRIGIQIDVDHLFEKFWIRKIIGFIEIPDGIRQICLVFEKIKDLKKELEFLCSYYPNIQDKSKVDKTNFEKAVADYESLHDLSLDLTNFYKSGMISEKNNEVQFSELDYYEGFIKYWDEASFILALYKEKRHDRKLVIKKTIFKEFHDSFKNLYSHCPSEEMFLEQKVIQPYEGEWYRIDFYNTDPRYWGELDDKICGTYWGLLLEDNTYNSDEERVMFFISQLRYYGLPYDTLLYSTEDQQKRFIDAAFNLIIEDQDSIGAGEEFKKANLDSDRHISIGSISRNENYSAITINPSDPFELFESLDQWSEMRQASGFTEQSARSKLLYLVSTIVKYDFEVERVKTADIDKPEIHRYKRIFSLLGISLERPIILWFVVQEIRRRRRDIIPYLLSNKTYISLSFYIIDGFEFPDYRQAYLYEKLWADCVELALIHLRSIATEKEILAKVIFQIYRRLNANKYEIPYNRQSPSNETLVLQEREKKEKHILAILENSPIDNHRVYNGGDGYLVPWIFNELLKCFSDFEIKPFYRNGTIQFPMLQWNGLAWLMKCSTYWKYKNQFASQFSDIHNLTTTFFTLYMSRIEIVEIEKYNPFQDKEVTGLPLWSEKIERLQHIEWIYPIYFFNKQQKLNSFLEPRFTFDTTEDQYHKKNQFVAEKLRTHIGVLLQVLRTLVTSELPYGFIKEEVVEIKLKIEQQIIDYLRSHSKDVPQQGRIDLFSYQREIGFDSSGKEALLPEIARAFTWFTNKEAIIDAIIETGDIIKILTLVDQITSEGIRQTLIEKISKSNLQSFLEKSHWIPEIHTALLKITRYPQLMEQIDEIVKYWETNISGKTKEYGDQLFQSKLLIAYFNKDEAALNAIPDSPKDGTRSMSELSSHDHKQFYRALLNMEDDPLKAHMIFNELVSRYAGKYPVFAMNRMAAKINVAKQKNDDTGIYSESIEEWAVYQTENPDLDIAALGKNLIINKLGVLQKTQRIVELDTEYEKLEIPYRMLPEILEIKIQRLLDESKVVEAISLLETAEKYHLFSGVTEIEFINDLKLKVHGIDNVIELRAHYNRIFTSPAEKLINIFPEKLNGRNDLGEFIVNEIVLAASRMLDKIKAIDEINDENKYNDIIQLALESRIGLWGWTVKDQTRKASSPSQIGLGEIDLDILDWNKKSMATCEAFILKNPALVESHLGKLMAHYTHNRNILIALIYYTDTNDKFEDKWKKYSSSTVPNLKFPIGYEIDRSGVEDLTKQFDSQRTGIKIGRSIHGTGNRLFHVFVNINYTV